MSVMKKKRILGLLRLTCVYAVVTAVAVFIVISRINASIVTDVNSDTRHETAAIPPDISGYSSNVSGVPATVIKGTGILGIIKGVPANADFLSFSYDGSYCVYCLKGSLYIIDAKTGRAAGKVSHKAPVTDAILMYDRNIVIYFTSLNDAVGAKRAGSARITVYTYNLDDGQETVQNSFSARAGSTVRMADYSSLTGHISFVAGTGGRDTVYYINLFKNLAGTPAGGQVTDMALVNKSQAVYYTAGNSLYYQFRPVMSLKSTKTRLLGCDLSDDAFVQSQNDYTRVYVLRGTAVKSRIRLEDTGFSGVYSTKTGIWLIYPGRITNLASPGESISYGRDLTFAGMAGGCLYLRDRSGDILVRSL